MPGGGAARWKGGKRRAWGFKTMWHGIESYEPKTAGPGIGAWLWLYQTDLEREEPGGLGALGLGAVSLREVSCWWGGARLMNRSLECSKEL